MHEFNVTKLKKLYIPPQNSHKGQNGKVMVIAGSSLFHAAALWSLKAASHLADMVYFASTNDNNQIVKQAKKEFRNGIVVPRDKIDDYISEADSVLIGPGLPRKDGQSKADDDTYKMTKRLLKKYKDNNWVIDGGSLQVMDPEWIPPNSILTPHIKEFFRLFQVQNTKFKDQNENEKCKTVQNLSKKYSCIIVLKGKRDIVCSPNQCVVISGGNAGMAKGGTGDVLAGVAVGLYAKNDAFLSASAASYFNKKASESLFEKKGYWYNTSDLLDEIPRVMKHTLLQLKV